MDGVIDANETLRALIEELPYCDELVATIVHYELAKGGVFVPPDDEAAINPDAHFRHVLYLLAKTNSLLWTPPAFMEKLLPKGHLSDFHCFFIRYCIEHNIPNVLQAYLDAHQLLMDKATIHQDVARIFDGSLPSPWWVKALFLMRIREDLFEASLLNAKTSLVSTVYIGCADILPSGCG